MLKIRALQIKVQVFFLLLFCGHLANAQRPFGNEWINFSQPYYKIKIAKEGVYRLDQNALIAAGVNVSSLNPQKLQLFFRGKQVPIYVAGETDGVFDAGDYFEFRGRRNDGALDAMLFANPNDISHTDNSTYTDTAVYFLTISEQGPYERIVQSGTSSGAGAVQSIIGSKAKYFRNIYQDGNPIIYDDAGRFIPEYSAGEGWMSAFYNTSDASKPRQKIDTFILDDALVGSSFTPSLEVKVISQNFSKSINPDHRLQVSVESGSAPKHIILDTFYEGYQVIRRVLPLKEDDLKGQAIVYITPVNVAGGILSTVAVAYEKITYEKELNAASQLNVPFDFGPQPGGGNITFGFQVPGSFGTPALLLYDLTGGYRAQSFYENGMVYFTLPAPAVLSQYILVKESNYAGVSAAPVTFRKIDIAQGYNFLLVTHNKLLNAAKQYAAYKETQKISAQENFKPLVVTVDELYDGFSYGVKHPMAIQNFSAYMYKSAASPPQYLFLFGKGAPVNSARSQASQDLVPSIGLPATDLLYVAGIQKGFTGLDTVRPVMGVGRLPARTEADALAYFEKLKEYDSSLKALWHKDAIHVGGGQDLMVQQIAESILRRTEKIFEDRNVGGEVRTFLAKSSTELNPDLRGVIQKEIEGGAALLTYYGHAAGTLLGVEIADFTTLSNKGKYPIMYLNGCNVGDASIIGSATIAENYLVKPDKGAISWISHSNAALSNTLEAQMIRFYQNMSEDSLYGASVGKLWAKSITDLKIPRSINSMERHAAFAWTIQGDPSVRFHFQQLPDYAVHDSEISISPADVIASTDVFYLKIPINNFGRATDALPGICVKQVLPNGQVWEHETEFVSQGVYYRDTFEMAIYPAGKQIQGMNRFIVEINCDKSIEETDLTNNRAEFQFFIQGTGARALFPANYSVIGADTVTLVTQSRDLFDTAAEVFFEIDTVHTFSSPFKKMSGLIKGGNINSWKTELLKEDSTVYYWRTRLNLPPGSGGDWDVRSFTYMKGRGPGWSQSEWPQFRGITGDGISIDTLARRFDYQKSYAQLGIKMNAWLLNGLGITREGELVTFCWFGSSTLAMVEIDGATLKPAIHRKITFGTCNGRTVNYNAYNMNDPAERQIFVNDMAKVKNGNYVAITTRFQFQSFKNWEPEVIAAFRKIGSEVVQDIKRDSTAFIIAGVKGETQGTLLDEDYKFDAEYNPKAGDTVSIRKTLVGTPNPSGAITSEKIGPSTKWKSVHQDWQSLENPSDDESYIQVFGINDTTGEEEVIINRIDSDSADLSGIDPNRYKFIYLRAFLTDTTAFSPAQLGNWTVFFDPVPEGTLVIDDQFRFEKDTVAQGDNVYIKIRYQNISPYPMKEMLVTSTLVDANGQPSGISKDKRYPALAPGAHFYAEDTLQVPVDLAGANLLSVLVNPNFDQPELSLENNFIKKSFYVPTGHYNPLLDVTFDGRHLRYMDIVSTSPLIQINAWGENTGMPLYDTSFFEVTLTGPDNTGPSRIYFSSPELEYEWGALKDNHAKITYTPILAPGVYTFTAQVRDVKGQVSGERPYSVTFKVIGESKASRIYLYPNPVTGTSRFVFTLTGDEAPDQIAIQIFNMRGQMVNELSLGSANPHIGYNEVEWDGSSSSGDFLPDGLYLYRVTMRKNGQELPVYGVPDDQTLEKTYGKLLILRE